MKTLVHLTNVELNADAFYDVSAEEAQTELDAFVGQTLDISDWMENADHDEWEATRDWLEEKTGLLVDWLEITTRY